jgi:uncharacterized membrane protein YkgB
MSAQWYRVVVTRKANKMTTKQTLIITLSIVAVFALFIAVGVWSFVEFNAPDFQPVCLNEDLAICDR